MRTSTTTPRDWARMLLLGMKLRHAYGSQRAILQDEIMVAFRSDTLFEIRETESN